MLKLSKKQRFPWAVIETAVFFTLKDDLSYRSVSEKMENIGVKVSHKTVYEWVHKFADYVTLSRRCLTQYQIEESYVRCNGESLFMYRAVNKKMLTLGIFLRSKRNRGVAEKHFAKIEQ